MPSPVGHALAGIAIAWCAPRTPGEGAGPTPLSGLTVTCAALAALPDADLVYPPMHRTITHGVGSAILVTIIAAGVTGWVTKRGPWRIALVCGAAYASHILLDWLGSDPNPPIGIQALWPFSHDWYIAPWTIFPGTERRHLFTTAALVTNAWSVAVEVVVLSPFLLAIAWWRRTKLRTGREF